jgi:hypothetical protein
MVENQMKNAFFIIFTVIIGVLAMQCKHVLPVPEKVIVNDSVCFSNEIQPLFVYDCAQQGCHDNITRQSNVNMSSYSTTVATISGSLLKQVIEDPNSHQTAAYFPLSSAQIRLVKNWVDEGMKNDVNCQSCDSSNVTFSGTINPIIQSDCISCHYNTGTILATYNDVKVTANNGKFLCTVQQNGCQAMPQGGRLSDCKINQIRIWVAAGAPNN